MSVQTPFCFDTYPHLQVVEFDSQVCGCKASWEGRDFKGRFQNLYMNANHCALAWGLEVHESYIINSLILHEYRINWYITYKVIWKVWRSKFLILLFFSLHDFINVEIHCNIDCMLAFYVLGSIKVGLCNHSDKIIKKC